MKLASQQRGQKRGHADIADILRGAEISCAPAIEQIHIFTCFYARFGPIWRRGPKPCNRCPRCPRCPRLSDSKQVSYQEACQ